MMSDATCPYCGHEQEINHDDGYGYDEDETFEQECESCENEFKFTTSISLYHEAFCQDDDHDVEINISNGDLGNYQHKSCSKCDWRECTKL